MLIILCSGDIQSVCSPFTFGEMSRYTNVVEVQCHACKKECAVTDIDCQIASES